MKTLETIRTEIDGIDKQISVLFSQRMGLSEQVAQFKLQTGDAIYKPEREEQILSLLISGMPEDVGRKAKSLFSSIILLSRELQYQHFVNNGTAVRCIEKFYQQQDKTDKTGVFYGDDFSWSHLASKKLCPDAEMMGVATFDAVFEAVSAGQAEVGVIPVENSTAGTVREVYDLLLKSGLYITATTNLDIAYCLAVKEGTNKKDIKSIYSHPQSLSQCKDYIKKHGFSSIGYPNTAGAAKFVATNADRHSAALCNIMAVEKYGLVSLETGVRDSNFNTTRFIKISKEPTVSQCADTVSMALTIDDRAGILAAAASIFRDNGINMHKVESRPIPDSPSEYSLYVDFVGNLFNVHTRSMLLQLESEFKDVCVFGNYKCV